MKLNWALLGCAAVLGCAQGENKPSSASVSAETPTASLGTISTESVNGLSETVPSVGSPVSVPASSPVASQTQTGSTVVDPDLNNSSGLVPGAIVQGDPNRYQYAFFATEITPMDTTGNLFPMTEVILSADPNFCSRRYAPMFISDIIMFHQMDPDDGNAVIGNEMVLTSPAFLAHTENDDWPGGATGYGEIGFHGDGCELFSGPLARGAPGAKWSLTTTRGQVDSTAQTANFTANIRSAGQNLDYRMVASRCDAVLNYKPFFIGNHGGWIYIPCERTILPGADPF